MIFTIKSAKLTGHCSKYDGPEKTTMSRLSFFIVLTATFTASNGIYSKVSVEIYFEVTVSKD